MMNRVEMIGRITKDIEVRKTQTGLSVARFTVACNRPVQKGKNQEADFMQKKVLLSVSREVFEQVRMIVMMAQSNL